MDSSQNHDKFLSPEEPAQNLSDVHFVNPFTENNFRNSYVSSSGSLSIDDNTTSESSQKRKIFLDKLNEVHFHFIIFL